MNDLNGGSGGASVSVKGFGRLVMRAGEVRAAKVVPGGGGAPGGSPVIAYTKDFRDETDVLRAGLALRARFGEPHVKLLYKPDVFTLCDQERLFETGPRGGRRPIPKCPYQLLPGAVELKIVEKSLALAGAMAVEPWARQTAAEDDEVREERGAVLGKERGTKDEPIEL